MHLRYYRSEEQYSRLPQFSHTRSPSFCKDKEKRRMLQRAKGNVVQKGVDVYVMIPPKPFQSRPPLNSMTFLRLKSTERKRRETPSSIVFEGHQTVLCLVMICLKYSMHMISPQKHCHQSPKLLRDKYALTAINSSSKSGRRPSSLKCYNSKTNSSRTRVAKLDKN